LTQAKRRRWDRVAEAAGAAPPLDALTVQLRHGKALYLKRCELAVFKARTEGPICFSACEAPFFSIVICAFNKFIYNIRVMELLEHALSYTRARSGLGIEIIFIDDGSTDDTSRLEDHVKGVVFRRVSPNIGFLRACNFGASLAKGEYLVFLNNDIEFAPDIFLRLYDAIERDKAEVACFGGEILQFNGSIQDFGSGIWRDGVAQGYFRNEPPTRYAYAYPRDVDYVAGCFFCISAAEFRDFNGFDDCFAPGYYEEADLSLRLWKAGRRSRVYPDIRVYHLEYGSFSSEASHGSLELMARNRPLFASRHRELLDQRREIKPDAGFHLQHSSGRPRVLFIEDRVPALRLGTGYGRAEIIVRALAKKADVDILSIFPKDDEALPDGFEYFDISYGPDVEFLQQRLSSRRYDVVYICRPHNLAAYADVLRAWKRGGGAIVYDTEAIFAVREVARAEAAESYAAITGSARFADLLENELRPAEIADAIVAVSDAETAILRRQFNRPVLTIGHHLPLRSLGRDPTARSGLLFVGSLRGVDSPNYDSLVWFLDRVWPRIRANRQGETLRIAGFVEPGTSLQSLQREGVTCLGPVADLTAEYERARVFIAPTRFAAGLPFKVGEALSYGLPVVSSVLVSEQLAQDGKTIGGVAAATVRDDGKAFAEACLRLLEDDDLWLEMQREAVKHMETCCAPSALGAAIDALLRELRETPRAAVDPERDLRSHDESRTINLEEWREEVVLSDSTSPNLARPIGIFVHLYYEDLAQEVAGYLALIELPKRIYVSTDTEEKREIVVRAFERSGLGPATEIAIVPNCGYDVAPFIVHFLNKIADHDICLKIHGKRSASERMEFGQRWRTLLFQDLIGDQERVRRIVNTILANPDLGVLMAQHYYRIEACVNIGLNYPSMRNILGRLGIDLRPDQKIEFPTASMFWFRSEALAGLAALGLKWSDFEGDGPQKDGTLAHAIERCFLFSGASAGKRWGFLPLYRTGPKIPRDEFVRRIRSSGAFDEEYYKKANPDVAAAGVNPFEHWINVGAREAREPSDPRHVNPEVYRYLEHHYRGLPLEGNKSSKSPWALRVFERSKSRTEPRGRATSPHFSPLKPSDPSTRYEELAPKASFAPIPPSFVFGPFPEFLTQAYFADVTALSVGCYTLNNVGVTSHSLLVRDGALLTCAQLNLSQESITEAAAYGKLCANVEFSRVLDEPVVSLAGPGHLVYGHWLVDFLPKLYVLHRSGINPFAAKYLLPSNTPEFATSWLQMLGISASQLIFFEPYAEVVGAAHLFVPTLLRTNGRTHPLFRSAIEYLLSLLPCKGEPGSVTGRGARLYLSRGGPGRENRKLLNRQAIESVAAEAGYAVVRPETLSIAEQLTMFARAKTIVGEYGSALHGSLFAQPGTMVCALRASARHPGFLQSGLCQAMEQQIGYVFGQAGEHDVEQEFTIREDDFKTALGLIDIC
jgi:capsular polysaccharide biosynthesis protein/GT2 family glycosyltransferase